MRRAVPVFPGFAAGRTGPWRPCGRNEDHAAASTDGQVAHDADRLASPRVRRAAAARAVRSVGTASPVLCESLYAPAESSGQSHEVGGVQVRVGPAMPMPPPGSEAAGGAAHRTIGVQDDAIHAPVRGIEEIDVVAAHIIGRHRRGSVSTRSVDFNGLAEANFFGATSPKKRSILLLLEKPM